MKKLKRFINHGGAWKVAYADFTTGMMALFMVLWILSQDEEVIVATTRYFQDPYMAGVPKSTPVSQPDGRKGSMVDQIMGRSDSTMKNSDDTSSIDIAILYQIAQDFYRRLRINEIKPDDPIQIEVLTDRVRIVLFDKSDRPLFVGHTDKLTEWGELVMQNMAWEMDRYQMDVRIDAHTASPIKGNEYDAWEVGAKQGNTARRMLTYYGLASEKIERVSSFGDSIPLDPNNTQAEKNKRLELSLVIRRDL
jgi:chemotaxis protein MotB